MIMGAPLNKDKMIQKLRDFYEENGRTPVYEDFNKGTPNSKTYGKYFGSWDNALELAGLLEIKNSKRQPKVYSDEELLESLKNYCNKYGKSIPVSDIKNDGYYTGKIYLKRFGSMKNALNMIGMGHLWGDKDKFVKRWTKDEIINIIIDFCNTNNRIPKNKDFAKGTSGNTPSINAILQHWESWDSVLLDIKNFLPNFSDKVDNYFYEFSEQYMYDKFMRLYVELGRIPSFEEINMCEYMPNYSTYINKFGGYKEFLIKVDLFELVEDKDKKRYVHNYTAQDLLNKLERYIKDNNKIPQCKDLDSDLNMPCMRTYEDYFGSYITALDLLGFKEQFLEINPMSKRYTNKEIENNLIKLYKELNRTPTFEDLDECSYTANSGTYSNRYGYLSNAFDICNIPYSKKFKFKRSFGKYIKKHITPRGTLCLSKSEFIITCWLEDNNLEYIKEIYYKDFLEGDNSRRKIDWIIEYNNKLYYVEYFGLYFNRLYKKKANKKIDDCREKGIDLIAILPHDLKNRTMEEIFDFVV